MSHDIGTHRTTDEGHRPAGTEDLLVESDASERDRVDDRTDAEGRDVQEADVREADEGRLDSQDRTDDRDQLAESRYGEGLSSVPPGVPPGDQDRLADESRVGEQDWRAGEERVDSQEGVDGELGDVRSAQYEPAESTPAEPTPSAEQASPSVGPGDGEVAPLFAASDVEGLRTRWMQLQAAFVDDPRDAVQQADQLVAEVIQNLAAMFNASKRELEGQWRREGTADTEDLRQALRRYRTFFDRMLRN